MWGDCPGIACGSRRSLCVNCEFGGQKSIWTCQSLFCWSSGKVSQTLWGNSRPSGHYLDTPKLGPRRAPETEDTPSDHLPFLGDTLRTLRGRRARETHVAGLGLGKTWPIQDRKNSNSQNRAKIHQKYKKNGVFWVYSCPIFFLVGPFSYSVGGHKFFASRGVRKSRYISLIFLAFFSVTKARKQPKKQGFAFPGEPLNSLGKKEKHSKSKDFFFAREKNRNCLQ